MQRAPLQVMLSDGTPFGFTGQVWIASLGPANHDRAINGYTIQGPVGSRLVVYFDDKLIDTTPYGTANQQEYTKEKILYRGEPLYLVWSTGSGSQPSATVFYFDQWQAPR